MNKYRTPNLYKYIFVLGSLVNFRVMQDDDEAANKGKQLIRKILANPEDDRKYIGRAEKLLNKIAPPLAIAKAMKAEIVEDEDNVDLIFWECVARDVYRMNY